MPKIKKIYKRVQAKVLQLTSNRPLSYHYVFNDIWSVHPSTNFNQYIFWLWLVAHLTQHGKVYWKSLVFALHMCIVYHQFLKWHRHEVSLELNGPQSPATRLIHCCWALYEKWFLPIHLTNFIQNSIHAFKSYSPGRLIRGYSVRIFLGILALAAY